MSSNGSCTTNSASPVMQILVEKLGIKMREVHEAIRETMEKYAAVACKQSRQIKQ